ncbi:MAG: hypothetical protein E7615_00540 [Ruminococcaceae bacterium]|nr:hypothetical protein [Oscillospiraceae bacterium]
MKKLMLLLVALLTVSLLAACGGETEKTDKTETNETVEGNPGSTDGETPSSDEPIRMTDEEKAKYYKVVEFELPKENFRDVIVDYMRKQSDIEWVCAADFSVSEKWAHWGISLNFKKGQTYRGIPYADTKVSYIQFENALVNGKYTCASDKWKDVYGVQCISSIMNSIQQFDPTVAGTSNQMMPSYDKFEAKICGEYEVPKGVNRTKDIIEANGEEVMFEALKQLKKGDIIMTKNDREGTSHFRVLVEEPTIYTNNLGKVVPSRCYVKTIEQTNAFDSKRNDGVKTTWFVDHVYSFADLLKSNYIPLTLESYSKDISEMEVPYILLDEAIKPEVLAKKTFNGAVRSNFPIRYVQLDVLDKSGVVVASLIKGDMADTRSVPLRNHFSDLFNNVKPGDYTLVVTGGIAIDSAELARVDFTLPA